MLLVALAPGCSRSLCAPETNAHRQLGDLTVSLRAGPAAGLDVGEPMAASVDAESINGAGHVLYLTVQDRPPILVHASSTDASGRPFDGPPTEEQLDAAVNACQVKASEDGRHVAFRPSSTGPWQVFHMLPVGVPFDAPGTDGANLSKLPPPEQIARDVITDPEREYGRDWTLPWKAVSQQPASSRWDEMVIGVWPQAAPSHEILAGWVEEGPGERTDRILDRAVKKVVQGRAAADVEKGCDLILRSGDADATAAMDDALLTHWPQGYIHDLILERLAPPTPDTTTVEPTGAFREQAATRAGEEIRQGKRIAQACQLMMATSLDDAVSRALTALVTRWPGSDAAHRFIMDHLDQAPQGFLDELDAAARAHMEDPDAEPSRRVREALDAVQKLRPAEEQ